MKATVFIDAHDAHGRPAIGMWSEPRTIKQRKNGSYFWVVDGRRQTVTRRADGSFYLKLIAGEPR